MNARQLKKFLSLPVNSDETWQGGVISTSEALALEVPDDADDLLMVLWRSAHTHLVHAAPIAVSKSHQQDGFVEVMCEFASQLDFPFRPARIECNNRELSDGLQDLLEDSGTQVKFKATMPKWDDIVDELLEQLAMTGPQLPSLMDSGCSQRQIREFAEAAAAFYRTGLWQYLDDVDLIQIESPKPPRFLKYAVVLGAAAETYGLGFYQDAEDHYDLMAQRVDVRNIGLFSLAFDCPENVVSEDVELWNELSLPLETGEAFPMMTFFSEKEMRRPSPKELDFATIILKVLAETSEEDIDSGQWTKTVEVFGKNKKCVLSVPNLLDPPDRAEWMRRGLMPETRGNESLFRKVHEFIEENADVASLDELNAEINARFTGPVDDSTFSMETPAERAEALCHSAIESFGRRRIHLARQALAEDPTHVESNILLAESTSDVEARIARFQDAVNMARAELGTLMEDAAGEFWGVIETRPYMRACHGLASALHEAGQTSEAIEQYLAMLELNPNDNQGVRYELMPLLVVHNREDQALSLLEAYREETAFWHYMNALAEFRRKGRSAGARQSVRAAFRVNKHVVPLMKAGEPLLFPDSYALGSAEEAAVCIREMAEAWDETEGFVDWILDEYDTWDIDQQKRQRDRKRKQRNKAKSAKGKRRSR